MLGQAALAMWWDMAPAMRQEFEHWHTHEHFPERLALPGFLRGSRWADQGGGEGFFILYELAAYEALVSPEYLARLNDPTPWSRQLMPHHRNMVRSLCHVRSGYGRGLGGSMATLRLERALATLAERKGVSAAHLLQAQSMAGAPQTAEQKLRGGDAEAPWVGLIGGYDEDAVTRAANELVGDGVMGLYRLSYLL